MGLSLLLSFLLLPGGAPLTIPEGQGEALKKIVDLGPLAEYFTLLEVRHETTDFQGNTFHFKLEAKKDVDTTLLTNYKVGFFDRDNHLHLASELRFVAGFPLKAGERLMATSWDGREWRSWHRIAVRQVENQPVKERRANPFNK
jgi:hypothetical protein